MERKGKEGRNLSNRGSLSNQCLRPVVVSYCPACADAAAAAVLPASEIHSINLKGMEAGRGEEGGRGGRFSERRDERDMLQNGRQPAVPGRSLKRDKW
jgi:hypothetical protein